MVNWVCWVVFVDGLFPLMVLCMRWWNEPRLLSSRELLIALLEAFFSGWRSPKLKWPLFEAEGLGRCRMLELYLVFLFELLWDRLCVDLPFFYSC